MSGLTTYGVTLPFEWGYPIRDLVAAEGMTLNAFMAREVLAVTHGVDPSRAAAARNITRKQVVLEALKVRLGDKLPDVPLSYTARKVDPRLNKAKRPLSISFSDDARNAVERMAAQEKITAEEWVVWRVEKWLHDSARKQRERLESADAKAS